jgi:hypothetical protein
VSQKTDDTRSTNLFLHSGSATEALEQEVAEVSTALLAYYKYECQPCTASSKYGHDNASCERSGPP